MLESKQKTEFSQAVLFDVDGVLVDSYEAHLNSWQTVAQETGIQFTTEQFALTFGRTSREVIRACWPHEFHGEQAVNYLDERKESLYRELVSQCFPMMAGGPELISQLHEAGFAMALASSGPKANIELAIDQLGIRESIQAVVTGEDVTRGKPDPQVFMLAAERLGVEPPQCVVIEDAPAGIIAAGAAGMISVALLSRGRSRHDFIEERPTRFIQSLSEISAASLRGMLADRS